ncbi:hypothetical protein K502DRAFT_360534, partial [Neoconidiobolus thromboides FSU 785]
IELLIHTYKRELVNINNNENIVYLVNPDTLLKQPATGYGAFLQSGLKIYLKYIDLYQMWYTRKEFSALLTNAEPNLSSHAILVLLAYFLCLKNSTLGHHIYKIHFKKAKECLVEAYANPSFDNVIGILFMCFISGYRAEPVVSLRYFSSAIRMAQLLGYNKSVREMLEENKRKSEYVKGVEEIEVEFEKRKRGIELWNSLSLVYYTILSIFPNMPRLNVNFKPVKIDLSKNIQDGLEVNSSYPSIGLEINSVFLNNEFEKVHSEKIAAESFAEITAHVQNIKLNYSRLDKVYEIPHHELQLPKEKFNTVLTNLTSQLVNNPSLFEITKKIELNQQVKDMKAIQQCYKSNVFKYHLNAFCNLILIYLYYPSLLVFPRPKKFYINEAIVLYKSAQSVAEFFLIMKRNNIQQTHGRNRGAFACSRCEFASNDGFRVNYDAPYYTPLMYIIYVYLAFISEKDWLLSQGLGQKFMIEAKGYVLKLLRLLKTACDSKLKSEKLDSENTIKSIKENLNSFEVDEMILMSIKDIIT